MENYSRCLLLSIDGTEVSLRPVHFLGRLFPNLDKVNIVICYILPSLPPVFEDEYGTIEMEMKKRKLLETRMENCRAILTRAKELLIQAGFSDAQLQEHVQEKTLSAARETCVLADLKKVDAVVIHKQVCLSFKTILTDDPTTLLLNYCLFSPVWVVEGTPDLSRAAFLIQNEDVALRVVDHASFMLADTNTEIKLLVTARSASRQILSPSHVSTHTPELQDWLTTTEGKKIEPYITESCSIVREAGIDDSRVQIVVIPRKGPVDSEILSYCQRQEIGILALGYPGSTGLKRFLKSLATKRILSNFKNMSIWISQ